MFRPTRQFIAVLLAIWLPLFSGNALAASVAMQTPSGDCHPVVAQAHERHIHLASIAHQYDSHHNDQSAATQDQPVGQQDKQNSSCKDCGVCHFACSGYLATVAINASETRLSTQTYVITSAQFQSFTSAPLDPPPLALV